MEMIKRKKRRGKKKKAGGVDGLGTLSWGPLLAPAPRGGNSRAQEHAKAALRREHPHSYQTGGVEGADSAVVSHPVCWSPRLLDSAWCRISARILTPCPVLERRRHTPPAYQIRAHHEELGQRERPVQEVTWQMAPPGLEQATRPACSVAWAIKSKAWAGDRPLK